MKIALPLDEDKKSVCVAFGRAPFFLVHDTDTKTQEIVPNPGAAAEGGAGLKAAQAVTDSGAQALITPRCGENAAEVFRAAEIRIYQSQGRAAADNIFAFEAGKLEELTHFHAGYHGIR